MGLTAWTMVITATSASGCALVGCYLVLRRLSLLGDAISHAVLPGLVGAFLITRQVGGWPAVLGALLAGALTPVVADAVHRRSRIPEDAALGVVFTTLFALGVVLLGVAGGADLDPGCVLYGLLEMAPTDLVSLSGVLVPRCLLTLVPILAATAGLLVLFWKEIQLTAFDPAHAAATGMPAGLVHHAVLVLTAAIVVASFEALGSILVVAMLIVPPVTAQLLTRRLHHMLAVAAALGVLAAVGGTLLATWLNTSVAGMMAVVAGVALAGVLAVQKASGST